MEYERRHRGCSLKRVRLPGVASGDLTATPVSKATAVNPHQGRHQSPPYSLQCYEYQRLGIDRLVYDIWGQEVRLSTLLQRNGIGDVDIQVLKRRLHYLYPSLAEGWYFWFHTALPGPVANLLDRRYSLHGEPPASLRDLQSRYEEPYQVLAQLEQRTLTYLRQGTVQRQMALAAVDIARRTLVPR